MRRFAIAWENAFPADVLADIVAALEGLLVGGSSEVSYKLRVRAAHVLGTSPQERRVVSKDLRDAYEYRSRIVHGNFVFDALPEAHLVERLYKKEKRPKKFREISEIYRLRGRTAEYFQRTVARLLDSGRLGVNWEDLGL